MSYSLTPVSHPNPSSRLHMVASSELIAIASHGHRMPLPRLRNQPVMCAAIGPKVRSTYSTMPPDIGIAQVSSPNTAPIGSRKTAPSTKAIIASTGPPPRIIQSPTSSTHPVPMIAPNPMVK